MLDHIILAVRDLSRSIAFYEAALAPLGITHYVDYDGENGHPDLKGFGRDKRAFFWLKSGEPSPGAVHFAFAAIASTDSSISSRLAYGFFEQRS